MAPLKKAGDVLKCVSLDGKVCILKIVEIFFWKSN